MESLSLEGVIGFDGSISSGLVLDNDDNHLIYGLGSAIVVKNIQKKTQRFLHKDGHDREISCLKVSNSGRYLASGQQTHMGFVAPVIIWDLNTCEAIHRLNLHKGQVQDVAFSPDEKYLASLGGVDDNKLVIWNLETGEAVCGQTAASDDALTVRFLNNANNKVVTAGQKNMRVWTIDYASPKLVPEDCRLGAKQRVIDCVAIDKQDEFMYCGTRSGDLLQIRLATTMFVQSGPKPKGCRSKQLPFSQGVKSVLLTRLRGEKCIVVGAGDGTVARMDGDLRVGKTLKLAGVGAVTSLCLNADGDHFFVGTSKSNIYLVHLETFAHELRSTSHAGKIYDVQFPAGSSNLFVTSSQDDFRVWNAHTCTELLRVQVPNLSCECLTITDDGKSIVTGWSDGQIRGFKPESGTLIYNINNAHQQGAVTAIAATHKRADYLVSGGIDGKVRVWHLKAQSKNKVIVTMFQSFKEHKTKVSSIVIKSDDTEFVTASQDGSCSVWDMLTWTRKGAFTASTQFTTIRYASEEAQFLTCGTDRKITFWDASDFSEIRIVDGSEEAELTTLAVAADGESFVSAGGDKLVKVWSYDEGVPYFVGRGHAGDINAVAIAPDMSTIVSVGNEGAVFVWRYPERFTKPPTGNANRE